MAKTTRRALNGLFGKFVVLCKVELALLALLCCPRHPKAEEGGGRSRLGSLKEGRQGTLLISKVDRQQRALVLITMQLPQRRSKLGLALRVESVVSLASNVEHDNVVSIGTAWNANQVVWLMTLERIP